MSDGMNSHKTIALKAMPHQSRTYNLYVEIVDKHGNEWIFDSHYTFPDLRLTEVQERIFLRTSLVKAVAESLDAEFFWGASIGEPTFTLLPAWQQVPWPKGVPSMQEQLRQSGVTKRHEIKAIR